MEPVVAERPESDHAGYERNTDNKHNGRESDGDGDDDDDCNEHVGEESDKSDGDEVDEVEPGRKGARPCTGVEGVGVIAVVWSLASRKRRVECWAHGGIIALLAVPKFEGEGSGISSVVGFKSVGKGRNGVWLPWEAAQMRKSRSKQSPHRVFFNL